jgi:hypothetical protein
MRALPASAHSGEAKNKPMKVVMARAARRTFIGP